MNHYLFLLTFELVMRSLWFHRAEARRDQSDFTQLYWIPAIILSQFFLLSLNWAVVTTVGEDKHETLEGRVTIADVTKLPHFLPYAPQGLSCPRSLFLFSPSPLRVRAVPVTSVGCPGNGGQTGSQLGCCWRGCHHCHVALGIAAGPSCWSLDRCGKSSSVTVLGPERLLMPNR